MYSLFFLVKKRGVDPSLGTQRLANSISQTSKREYALVIKQEHTLAPHNCSSQQKYGPDTKSENQGGKCKPIFGHHSLRFDGATG